MHWYVRCFDEWDDWTACVVHARDPHVAEHKALNWFDHAVYAEAVMFDTFTHGDPNDYEILA